MKRLPCVVALLSLCTVLAHAAELKTRNVVLVTIDGLRWQEVFRGAEEALMTRQNACDKLRLNKLKRYMLRSIRGLRPSHDP